MEVIVKHINPRKTLSYLGFSECKKHAGMEIVTKEEYGFPINRYHAIVVDKRIDIHYDRGTKTGEHKSSSHGKSVKKIIAAIKKLDKKPSFFESMKIALKIEKPKEYSL